MPTQVAARGGVARRPIILLKMVLVALFWGGTFVAGRVVSLSLSPLDGAALRFLVGGAGLALVLACQRRWPKVGVRDFALLVLMGLSGVIAYNLFFLSGMRYISAGRASLIVANNPIGIMLGMRIVFGEKLALRQIVGIVLSLAGAILVVLAGHEVGTSSGHWGELLIGGCVLSWTAYTLFARKVLARVPPLVATTYSTLAGALILLAGFAPFASVEKLASIPLNVWAAVVFLGLFGTAFAFTWYMDGVDLLGASQAGQFCNLVPVFAVLLSMGILGERPSARSLVGGMLVICGLLLTQTGGQVCRRAA